jgi:hypothetical protein
LLGFRVQLNRIFGRLVQCRVIRSGHELMRSRQSNRRRRILSSGALFRSLFGPLLLALSVDVFFGHDGGGCRRLDL